MFVPTLRRLTLIRIALSLYSEPEVLDLQLRYDKPLHLLPENKWQHLFARKLPPSEYPEQLRLEIIAAIRPISFEVFQFWMDHGELVPDTLNVYFKPDGTVDRMSTAEFLISCETLDLETRFVLACQYLPSEDTDLFWQELPPSFQTYIFQKYTSERLFTTPHEKNVVRWKELFLRKRGFRPVDNRELLFKPIGTVMTLCNPVLDSLGPDDRHSMFVDAFEASARNIPMGRLCLYRMNANERGSFLRSHPYQVLRIFLFCPLQPCFVETANGVWDIISNDCFLFLLHIMICQKIISKWNDFDYVLLLKQFWWKSPQRCRDYVAETRIYEILSRIIEDQVFCTSLRSHVPPRYLIHGRTLFENAEQCVRMTNLYEVINRN
ncbi:uncharacterized protein NPIL_244451 [Nephila pilipes]|uniref:Uncharacterized protein n=1 Tax=Nephila pilipes TaxID=299642 RepID=A0A8X6I792_NEPPI|nr:uncharacterized protein NPIL_244451 [Nephila pilipes]